MVFKRLNERKINDLKKPKWEISRFVHFVDRFGRIFISSQRCNSIHVVYLLQFQAHTLYYIYV